MNSFYTFWGGFFLGMLFIWTIIVLSGCANKPDIRTQLEKCTVVKAQGFDIFICYKNLPSNKIRIEK